MMMSRWWHQHRLCPTVTSAPPHYDISTAYGSWCDATVAAPPRAAQLAGCADAAAVGRDHVMIKQADLYARL